MIIEKILDRFNVLGSDNFEFSNFKMDQLKILVTALAISDAAYHTEKVVLFKLI